jgi:hypothetical protein
MFFKPKLDPAIPDSWKLTVRSINGSVNEYAVVSQLFKEDGTVELTTISDTTVLLFTRNIVAIEFDKDYTKVQERKVK